MKRDVKVERVYDHLYDPVYTVSSEVDHVRANLRAYASKERVKKVPVFESMFSCLPHHPSYEVQLNPVDPVPGFVDRRWRGYAERRQLVLKQLTGVIMPQREECHVTGADRWKFFNCPLIPLNQHTWTDHSLPFPKGEHALGKYAERRATHCTVGVQTDYRESETQTDPYSPEYVVKPGTTPAELLSLAVLTWGRGLPAGLAEVEKIERAREKRIWAATLPPLEDVSQLDKRRRMMEQKETEEWAFREAEIQKLQDARLAVLKDLLKQRDAAQTDAANDRLKKVHAELLKNKEVKLNKINGDYARALRKLETRRKNVEGKLTRGGLVKGSMEDYVRRHAPAATVKADSKREMQTFEGLQELESRRHSSALKQKKKPTDVKVDPSESKDLALIKKYKSLRAVKTEETTGRTSVAVQKEKRGPRPVTPTVEAPQEEEKELAVITLQKLLRGRSVQYKMCVGKENHRDLIRELRSIHTLQSDEEDLLKADKELVMTLKSQRDKRRHEVLQQKASQAGMLAAELENTFSTLSKELIHLQEERRIHAFALLAERDRRMREAEESGRRQAEERRRREEDEIFRQVVQVHQETVDLYLEDVILDAVDQTADKQAREEVHMMAREVNDIAYAMEERQEKNHQPEDIVSELVYSFLIPEVEKIRVRHAVHQKQLRHLQAARAVIHGHPEPFTEPSKSLQSDSAPKDSAQEPGTQGEPQSAVPSRLMCVAYNPAYMTPLNAAVPVPGFTDHRWRRRAEQRKHALQQLAGSIPKFQAWRCANRFRAASRKRLDYKVGVASGGDKTVPRSSNLTMGIQTDCRDSETQTDVYSPPCVIQPGTTPAELLTLAVLTWGRGLPARTEEVELIERARAKRAWEAKLPPLEDLSQLDKRKRMMDRMEANEWAFREGEIKKLQDARYNVLRHMHNLRNKSELQFTMDRLKELHAELVKRNGIRLNKINNDHARCLRKLRSWRSNVELKLIRQDVVDDLPDDFLPRYVPFTKTWDPYADIYDDLVVDPGLVVVEAPKPWPPPKELEILNTFKTLREELRLMRRPLGFRVKKEKPITRPATPTVEEPPEGEEDKELAVILLQKLLRGRSMQYMMLNGKEDNLELIKELRSVHALQKREQDLLALEKESILDLKTMRDQNNHEITLEEASQAQVIGAELEDLLDTFSKELVQLQEERRIHALALLAERDRLVREAEESGRRQVEEHRRKEEDKIFRDVVKVNQETVDLYLEDIILDTVEFTADQQAREEIHRLAKEVNDIAYALEESRNNLQSEEIVSELMYSFLIPEVEKISLRQKVHQRQQRHLQAARSIIYGAAEDSDFLPTLDDDEEGEEEEDLPEDEP
ncbi:cilia- and flagella-associated protein 91 [Neosynchiropus ocellatus]